MQKKSRVGVQVHTTYTVGVGAHTYHLSTWEVEAEEFEASLGCYYLACVGAG